MGRKIDTAHICMMYRRAHADKHIISIICTVHNLAGTQVKEILITQKLMTVDGEYIEPIRLTGKEITMAQWKWMPHRKKLFDRMKEEGKSLEHIATALGCTLEIVEEYDKAPRPIKPHKISVPAVQTVNSADPPAQDSTASTLLLHTLIRDARNLCDDAWSKNNDADNADLGYAIGRLHEKLNLAVAILDIPSSSS